MKSLYFFCAILMMVFTSYAQNCPTPPGSHVTALWENFDECLHHGAIVPSSAVSSQLNGAILSNCHGYAFYQATGRPIPSTTFDQINIFGFEFSTFINSFIIEEITPANIHLATHIVWHDESKSYGWSGFENVYHSAIFSQFNAFPRSLGYCQSANGMDPRLVVHKISDYEPQNSNLKIRYYRFRNQIAYPLVVPDYQPIAPISIFNCDIFIDQPISCYNGSDGKLIAYSAATTSPSTRSYHWSNNPLVNSIVNSNISAGTYTVTVTENPTFLQCTTEITISEPKSVFSHFDYTPHSSGVQCIGSLGDGAAIVNLAGHDPNDFSFQWDANARSQQGPEANGLCYGSYDVTITSNATGCSEVQTAQVPVGFGFRLGNSTEDTPLLLNVNWDQNAENIQIKGHAAASRAVIYDMNGRTILERSLINESERINMTEFRNGLYILTITDASGQILHQQKLITN